MKTEGVGKCSVKNNVIRQINSSSSGHLDFRRALKPLLSRLKVRFSWARAEIINDSRSTTRRRRLIDGSVRRAPTAKHNITWCALSMLYGCGEGSPEVKRREWEFLRKNCCTTIRSKSVGVFFSLYGPLLLFSLIDALSWCEGVELTRKFLGRMIRS